MKNPVMTFLLIVLMAMPAMAQEEAAAEPTATAEASDDGLGLSTGATLFYSSITGAYDADGKQEDMEDMSASSMVINVNAEYSLAAAVEGLYLGLDLPIVQNGWALDGDTKTAMEALDVDTSASTMGLGDMSLYAGYDYAVNDTMNVGGQLRFKLGTGAQAEEADQVDLGSGHNNIQVAVGMDMSPVDNLGIDLDAGYIITMEAEQDMDVGGSSVKVDVDPADGMYVNLGLGYTIADMVTPSLGVHYFSTGNHAANGDEIPDSDMNATGLTLNVDFKISDSLSANAGLGSNMIGRGINLPYGHVLAGKNTPTGMGFNLGCSGSF